MLEVRLAACWSQEGVGVVLAASANTTRAASIFSHCNDESVSCIIIHTNRTSGKQEMVK